MRDLTATLRIFDGSGRCCMEHPCLPGEGPEVSLDLGALAAGAYFVEVDFGVGGVVRWLWVRL